ncbi:hypothetical protein LWI28_003962 [Acer negundo]|uniref:Uncharacterized protein n=1 Tax=Acer negundo TaxID=4023 RepID=A0AAD5J3H3_ACENE|nr:hypothetical protein LWI28_003962 [Acer negundo]
MMCLRSKAVSIDTINHIHTNAWAFSDQPTHGFDSCASFPFPFFDFVLSYENRLKKDELELLCVVWWKIWNMRNHVVHSSPVFTVEEIFDWAVCYLEGFQKAIDSCSCLSVKPQVASLWQAPITESFKINTDAALDFNNNTSSLGEVASLWQAPTT